MIILLCKFHVKLLSFINGFALSKLVTVNLRFVIILSIFTNVENLVTLCLSEIKVILNV